MKARTSNIIALVTILVILAMSWHQNRQMHALATIADEAAARETRAIMLATAESQRKARPLGARNPKLTPAQQHLTSEDLDAMDAMKEGNFEEAAQILHEADRKPEDWLLELRKKWGSTNPDALLGPSWEEIQKWGEEKKP